MTSRNLVGPQPLNATVTGCTVGCKAIMFLLELLCCTGFCRLGFFAGVHSFVWRTRNQGVASNILRIGWWDHIGYHSVSCWVAKHQVSASYSSSWLRSICAPYDADRSKVELEKNDVRGRKLFCQFVSSALLCLLINMPHTYISTWSQKAGTS